VKSKRTKLNRVRNSTTAGHPEKGKISNGVNPVRAVLYVILAGCLVGMIGACENGRRKKVSLAEQIEKLQQEKAKLTSQIEESKKQNKQLKEQVRVLIDIRPEVKPEELYTLQRVKIHRYSGFYDKDGDGKKEKLVVYVQPVDKQGDIIKVPGSVDVQLEDWSGKRLGQWHVGVDELKQNWFSTLIGGNYRLMFDIADKVDDFTEPLTVKVTFTDYLTGRVFKEQRVIKPR